MQGPAGKGILSLSINDKALLYSAYMPFIKGGGLFVATSKDYNIGDEVFLLLSLMGEPEKIPVAGKIVWITPKAAHGNRKVGIGVQIPEDSADLTQKIEAYLAGSTDSGRITHTL